MKIRKCCNKCGKEYIRGDKIRIMEDQWVHYGCSEPMSTTFTVTSNIDDNYMEF